MDAMGFAEVAIREAWEIGMWWLTLVDGALPVGDLVYLLGCAVLGVSAAALLESTPMSAAAVGVVLAEAEDDDTETENKKLPNQGDVSEIEDAPPVDAGKQGKHVPGHNNNNPKKSQWNPGETGVKETQEAWKNGTDVPDRNGTIRIGESSDGRVIRVHIDQAGKIHGYPIP